MLGAANASFHQTTKSSHFGARAKAKKTPKNAFATSKAIYSHDKAYLTHQSARHNHSQSIPYTSYTTV